MSKIVLRGVLEKAFGNILCLRGFARLGDLAEVSQADDNYQRPIVDEHKDDVVAFLNGGEYTFFPELILGASLASLGLTPEEIDAFYRVPDTGGAFQYSRIYGISISTFVKKYGNAEFSRHITASIYNLERISFRKPFSRIDGNHRLEAVEMAQDRIKLYNAPFCLALFRNDDECRKFGTVFFHNINYRARPIPEEQNLRVIFEAKDDAENDVFGDDVLMTEKSFGRAYYDARRFLRTTDLSIVCNVSRMAESFVRTLFLRLFELLDEKGYEDDVVDIVKRALHRAEYALSKFDFERFDLGVAVALIYFAVYDSGRYIETFANWIAKNELQFLENKNVDPYWLISVFERTHRRGPYKVFVAMPYISNPHVNDFNKLFKEVLSELSNPKENGDGIRYELIPIMRFRGAAQRIDRRLIEKIKECDIFIADITGNNENVIFEVGLAEGNGKQMLLIRSNDDSKPDKVFVENEESVKSGGRVPFDMDKLQYIPYSASGYYNSIKSIVRNHLPEIVKKLG